MAPEYSALLEDLDNQIEFIVGDFSVNEILWAASTICRDVDITEFSFQDKDQGNPILIHDVSFKIAKDFTNTVKEKALGQGVITWWWKKVGLTVEFCWRPSAQLSMHQNRPLVLPICFARK